MADSAPTSPSPLRRKGIVLACGFVVIFGASEFVAARYLAHQLYTVQIPLSVLGLVLLTAGLLVAGAVLHFVSHWRRQVIRLRRALEEALNGELPIEALDQPFGGLSALTPAMQDLLRDLRRQRAEMAQLNLEMRQKVAQRTDALQRLVGRLRSQATRDELTGLYNRRMLDQSLDELVQRCAQDKAALCLLMIDVDDFKLLNDTLGHAAGDSLLRAIGQLIRSSVRQQDLAFRCGGDEFVIVLPQSARAEGEMLSKRLMDLIDALVKTLPVPRRPRLSIGISTLADLSGPVNGPELMQDADRRLYAAKFARKAPDPKGHAA
jgi:diguanylate cyclase (GGDEF)-like protein